MTDNYFIFTEEGDKFCRRYVDENGEVQLQTNNGTIPFSKFQVMALNPAEALKHRGKKQHRKKSTNLPKIEINNSEEIVY